METESRLKFKRKPIVNYLIFNSQLSVGVLCVVLCVPFVAEELYIGKTLWLIVAEQQQMRLFNC